MPHSTHDYVPDTMPLCRPGAEVDAYNHHDNAQHIDASEDVINPCLVMLLGAVAAVVSILVLLHTGAGTLPVLYASIFLPTGVGMTLFGAYHLVRQLSNTTPDTSNVAAKQAQPHAIPQPQASKHQQTLLQPPNKDPNNPFGLNDIPKPSNAQRFRNWLSGCTPAQPTNDQIEIQARL